MLPPSEVCFIHRLKFPESAIMLPLVQMHPHDNVCARVIPLFVLTEYYNLSGKIQLFTLHMWINRHYVSLGAAKAVKWVRMPWKDRLPSVHQLLDNYSRPSCKKNRWWVSISNVDFFSLMRSLAEVVCFHTKITMK